MKATFLVKIGAVFLTGSVLTVLPTAVQGADLYDSLKAFSDSQRMEMYGSKDVYDSMEPTAAGAQGPMRSDMYKDEGYAATGSGASSAYSAYWDALRMRLAPIGGEGTN
jgi:hypothetical protein